MQIISTNIGKPKTVLWKAQKVTTGIFKEPLDLPLHLGTEDVKNDHVNDRRVHGGIDKACYLFSADYYSYWQKEYPDLDWKYGMFGENLTVTGLNEEKVYIGDIYLVGEAQVQVSQPRQPCYKLGIKFKDQSILKKFIKHNHPGFYVRVLQEGHVRIGDEFMLQKSAESALSISAFFKSLYRKKL